MIEVALPLDMINTASVRESQDLLAQLPTQRPLPGFTP